MASPLLKYTLSCLLVWSYCLMRVVDSQAFPTENPSLDCPHCQDTCHGERSVAYVVDITGSMRNDIGQVCQRTREMASAITYHNLANSIQRCVLVPFGDPDIGPPQFFTAVDQLADAACDLRPSGGVDCPERVLSGLLMGLESSCPKSTIYMFTDAVAKDIDVLGKVLQVIQEKQIKVIFVLSGSCGAIETPYYDAIAALSGGQLFRTAKNDVGDILKFSQDSINNKPQVSLLWEKAHPPFWSSDFVIEEGMTSAQVVVSCDSDSPLVQLYEPGQLSPITSESHYSSITWGSFPHSVMVAIDTQAHLGMGLWQIYVSSESQCRVSITAHGVAELSSSFSKVTEINEFGEVVATVDPELGSNYVVVESPTSHIVQYIEFVGIDGNRFSTSSPTEGGLTLGSQGAKTVLGPAMVPNESFFVRYHGLQNVSHVDGIAEGKPFKRFSPMAMIPHANPSAQGTSSKIQAGHCQQLKLKCPKAATPKEAEANTIVPVAWFYDSKALFATSLQNVSVKDSPDRSTLHLQQFKYGQAGVYSCYVVKASGLVLAAEYNVSAEEVTERPCPRVASTSADGEAEPSKPTPSIWRPRHTSVKCLLLTCIAANLDTESNSVRWMNTLSTHHYDRSTVHRHFAVLRNGSLRICDPQPQHAGWYMCSSPRSSRPGAVQVTASDIQKESEAASDSVIDSQDEFELELKIVEGERDTARNEATVAQEKIVELQKEILSYQRQLHNSDADRLRAMQQVNSCQIRLTRVRAALGLVRKAQMSEPDAEP